jgi:hypothetical protein
MCEVGFRTQGLAYARQMFYHYSIPLAFLFVLVACLFGFDFWYWGWNSGRWHLLDRYSTTSAMPSALYLLLIGALIHYKLLIFRNKN